MRLNFAKSLLSTYPRHAVRLQFISGLALGKVLQEIGDTRRTRRTRMRNAAFCLVPWAKMFVKVSALSNPIWTIWVVARCSKNASWNLKRTSSLIQMSALGSFQLVCMVKLTQTALFLEIENKHKQKMQGLNPTSGLLARTIFIPIGVVRLPLPGTLTHLLYVRLGT